MFLDRIGHFPRCAMLNIGGSEIIEQARNILKEHGITDIYEVPKPDHNLSDEEQMQCLGLLHGCLEEGDKTSTTDDQKKICSNPKCRLLFEKSKTEAKEANKKSEKHVF